MSFKIVTCTDLLQRRQLSYNPTHLVMPPSMQIFSPVIKPAFSLQWFPYLNTIRYTKVWIGKK